MGHCGDNAACEGFFGLLKRERIRRQIYPTKDAARAEVFDYIEMFYNPNRRHGSTGDLSPVEFQGVGAAHRRAAPRTRPLDGL
ncbi:ISxac3 transposase [Pseudomonas syringae pv. maculicola]|nr:ISxac3 transposase [Pseudomonas savastanoi pv. phaseolicola]KPB83158.1 ISxac3 transposase [Pseudomonas syringae pv. maculicola]